MELFIDNIAVDTDDASRLALSLSVAVVTDPRRGRAGYTRTLRLPATPANDAVFGYAAEIHSRDRFNAVAHTGRVEHEGCVLIEGPLTLSRAGRDVDGGFYEVHIVGAAKEWASEAAMHSLSTLPVGWSGVVSASTISGSWTGNSPVRFLPVARETLQRDYSSGSVIPAARVLSSDDYHPFIHAATLLRVIFADAGYRVESDFVNGAFFDSLYISGNYPVRDVSAAKADMDFLARRFAAGSATANSQGRVYADPYRAAYTVGNIVDTADPTRTSAQGVNYDDVFTRGGCFQIDDDRVAFIPPREVSVGFQFHLRYTTDYRMSSRAELAGFDTVYLGEAAARTFTLANPWPDRRESFRPARSYNVAVFDHASGRQYQLRYSQGGAAVSSQALNARFSGVEVAGTQPVSNPVLWYRASSAAAWQPYGGDWALYDGFVGETGRLDVELTVRTAPERVTPGAPKFFDAIYFGGAEPGMTLTVGQQTWIRPVFYAQPTEGSVVSFADVCAHDASRMDFIAALRQMFDLCFHTDNREKVVRIEPAARFYSASRIVDWTERLDLGRPVVVEELGGDLSREMVWCYRGGDGAVARFNRNNGGQFGRWSATVESAAAADQTSVWENPMFTPSLSAADTCPGAPSALLVQAGDTSVETPDRTENLNFAPKIVRYEGMAPLPAGERWGWPLAGESYPRLAFHAPESGYTLCFEDRDGCTGLHSMWEGATRLWNHGRRITAWLALDAADIESLSFPTGEGPDFRALYRIALDGEECLCRLEEVCDYTPGAPSTKCILIKHIP